MIRTNRNEASYVYVMDVATFCSTFGTVCENLNAWMRIRIGKYASRTLTPRDRCSADEEQMTVLNERWKVVKGD